MNGHDVETARTLGKMVADDEVLGKGGDAPLFESSHGFCCVTEIVSIARLHFDEHERRAVARDDV